MEILNVILERRSIRHFTDKEIDNRLLEELLKSAMYAPSGGNAQPWDFIVIKDKKIISDLEKTSPYAMPLKTATCAIVVCGNTEKEKFKGLWVQDCSAATQNILLSAHSLGLGSTWLGVYPDTDRVDLTRNLINAPDYIIPLGIIALGYPNETKPVPDRFKLSNIHMNTW